MYSKPVWTQLPESAVPEATVGNLEIRKTPGKGHGLFTKDDIDEGEFVAEYCGDIISGKDYE